MLMINNKIGFMNFRSYSKAHRLPPRRFSGKRRSGVAESLVLLQRFAVLPLPLALPQDLPDPVDFVGNW